MAVPARDQHSLIPPPATINPPIIRCKKCGAVLQDSPWKNCDSCRRSRTESYNRWRARKSVAASGVDNLTVASGSSLVSKTGSPSVPRSNPNLPTTIMPGQGAYPYPSLSFQPSSFSAPLPDHDPNRLDHTGHPAPRTSDQPRTTPASTIPRPVNIPEYQWSDELINELLAQPPRPNFMGKFSVVADPAVDNPKRARMLVEELRAKGAPIPDREHLKPSSRDPSSNSYALIYLCTCQKACRGQFFISVEDDVSHPYGVAGQRNIVAVLHSKNHQ
ncbi:hypothetical protein BJV74DRAFT_346414, partial [Russula compacta]